jgi:hypothetical protein
MLLRSQAKAAEYHAKASDAAALAAASVLQRVRELHELAAYKWTQLAESEDRRTVFLARRDGRAAEAAAMTPAVLEDETASTG